MKNIDDITRTLARVAPGHPGAEPSGAGARTLLDSITTEEPGPVAARRRRPTRRLVLGLAGAALLAGGIVVGPPLLDHGASSSYAVTKDGDGIVYVRVRDFHDRAGLAKQLKDLNVPAIVDYAPPGKWCKEPRGAYVEDIPPGLYSLPENIPGQDEGWQMRIDTKLFKLDQTFVWTVGEGRTSTILMTGPVAPCVLVPEKKPVEYKPDYLLATVKGRTLAGIRVDEKTVGQVLPKLRNRGLKITYLVMDIPQGNPGGYGEGPTLKTSPGDDWIVWEAEQSVRDPKKIRLLVTDQRYDRNPIYGGPRDNVIKD